MIKKIIQDFFQEGTVTIVGSGLSLAEGIPGMGELAKKLQMEIPGLLSATGDIKNWNNIENDLAKGVGLEEALHNTKPSSYVEECIRKVTAIYIGESDKSLLTDIVKTGKQLRFSEYLQRFNIRNEGMTVITTNYDRLLEYACETNEIMADTLFVGKYIARFKPNQSKYASCIGVQRTNGKGKKLQYSPIERFIYKLAGINPNEEMDWKAFLKSLLIINVFWFFWGMILLVSQGYLPLNPDGNSGQSPDLAFNTCISFMVNCNLQHYSGESGLTYFTQLFVIMLFQFITAATGMAAMAGIMKSMAAKTTKTIGNFWHYLVISCTRILFPMSLIVGFILIIQGTPMGFDSKMTIPTLEGAEQTVSQGPTAAIVPIKQLGTNGGGYFGVNSSHPLENPTYLTNIVECWSILIIPMALVFALGFYLKRKKLGYVIYGVMLFAYLLGVFCNVHYEMAGNPKIDEMGIDQSCGAMEGKETRLGPGATALWSVTTTVTSNGSVNGMHDSTMPLSGMVEMLNMQINTWFGGVGVGFMNYYAFLIIAVFISGLMVGRTPEFLGKKVEAREMKIATIVSLAHPFVILIFTAISSYVWVYAPEFVESEGGWLNNPGFHGFSEMLYEYTSSSANNGSGFEGLGDNTYFWNYTCGLALIISRYLPIVGQVAIAGLLANKKYTPESAGTLKTDTVTFGVMTFFVIVIVAALSFFPAQTLGPIAEYFSIY